MNLIHIDDPSAGAKILAQKITDYLNKDKKVLWLLSGGSNISISVETLNILEGIFPDLSQKLAVTLTDERYGHVGHDDSNWQQLINTGFKFNLVQAQPILQNLPLEETIEKFNKNYSDLIKWSDITIAQFGVGTDGHTAGILPKSDRFTRISLSLEDIKGIPIAYTFIFGKNKERIFKILINENISTDEMPSQILKSIGESYICSDLV